MCPLGTVSENKKKPGWGAAGLENLICWEDGATFQAVPGFSVFCSLFVAVLGNREAHFLHQLLPTNKPPLPKWGGNLLPLEEAAGNTEVCSLLRLGGTPGKRQ